MGAHVRTYLAQVSIGPYPVQSLTTPSRSCGYDLDGHRARPRLISKSKFNHTLTETILISYAPVAIHRSADVQIQTTGGTVTHSDVVIN
jgi:hypothetical protein